RSPAIAARPASLLTRGARSAFALQFDAGILSVLVFGAGTNYARLLISRYREELHHHTDHRAALAQAWRRTIPAILASNVTVILSLATLAFAAIPGTRGLRSEEHTSELQSRFDLVCRLLLENKKQQ